MTTIQENHQDLENAVQAKLGDIEYRKKHGSMEDRLKAWGEYLIKKGRVNLTLEDHQRLHHAIVQAMKKGMSEVNADMWIQRGKNRICKC